MKQAEKLILKETKGMPSYVLDEVLDFIQFIKEKNLKKKRKDTLQNNIHLELSMLNQKELFHLEEEFKDYKELYPREK
jgi:hypothetical protein